MKWLDDPSVKTALVVVAHPDDETIFCGGAILSHPNIRWEIRVLTPDLVNSDWILRYDQLIRAIEKYKDLGVKNISQITLHFPDNSEKKFGEYTEGDINIITEKLKGSVIGFTPDIVLTHNRAGEYGHEQHKLVSHIAHKLFSNAWYFICPGAKNVIPQPYGVNNVIVPMSAEILDTKKKIFNLSYTSELGLWSGDLADLMQYEFRTGPEIFAHFTESN